VRDYVKRLVEMPNLILSDGASVETVDWAEEQIALFERPAQDDEAIALLKLLTRSDETSCFGLNWAILHFIETAPGWPIWPALQDAQGEWASLLKVGLRNAAVYRPDSN
jgi:hypothetical protein